MGMPLAQTGRPLQRAPPLGAEVVEVGNRKRGFLRMSWSFVWGMHNVERAQRDDGGVMLACFTS